MHSRAIVLSGLLLAAFALPLDRAHGQSSAPPSDAVVTTPIGKVVSAKGTVSVEHTIPIVAQVKVAPGSDGFKPADPERTGAIPARLAAEPDQVKPAGPDQIKLGDSVYKGDVLLTGADGAIGVVFSDGTALNLSKNARMVLNEFVYDPKGKANKSLFALGTGTFTLIAGKVAKSGDMKIDTPVATMGIRGTTPHVEISSDGTVTFSTLVEDKKAIEKLGKSIKRRPAAVPDRGDSTTESSPRKASRDETFKFTICRGC
jgi:FecR-like protein